VELRPSDLLKQWKAGQFKPAYYLVGEEHGAKEEAIDELKKRFGADDFNLCEFSGSSEEEAAAIVSEAMTLPAFSDKRLVIARHPKLSAGAKSALAEYLKDPLKSTTLVMFCDDKKADLKDPIAKACGSLGGLCVFAALGEEEAAARLIAEALALGKKMIVDAAAVLVAEAGTDWTVLSGELEKVCLFVAKRPEINADDVLACLGYQKTANPWKITDHVERRELKAAIAQLSRLMKDGKPDEQARGALYKIKDIVSRQLRARIMQRAQVSPDQIARSVRLYNPYMAREFLSRVSKMTEARLRRDLKRCLETETLLNQKSWLDPRMEIEQLVIDVCR
jgi:DNA polymerase III subunit delta